MTHTRELLRARYANSFEQIGSASLEHANPVLDTIFSHRSVRAFLNEPLPEGTLETLVAAGQSASSSSNLQIWSVVAVEDAERKQRLSALAGGQQHIREAPVFLAWLIDLSRLARIAERGQRPAEGLHYFDTFLMGAIDAALAAQSAVIAAESLGLGCVYIGALRNRPEQVAAELGLRPGLFAVFGLCVGTPDPQRPSAIKPRLPQRSVLFREQYVETEIEPVLHAYDHAMSEFYRSQGMPVASWSEHSVARVRGPEDLRGRHRLVEALRGQGFALR